MKKRKQNEIVVCFYRSYSIQWNKSFERNCEKYSYAQG
jgi:hypothetical protein